MSVLKRVGNGPALVNRLRDEMDDMFSRFFGPVDETLGSRVEWAPRVDVEETDKAVLVTADLPGVDPKDIEVSVLNNELILRGEKKQEKEEKGKNFHRVERFAGSFYRSLALPPGCDENGVTATAAQGVVTVTIPKKPEAKAKKIAVQAKEA
jgi:HSP20 family protein